VESPSLVISFKDRCRVSLDVAGLEYLVNCRFILKFENSATETTATELRLALMRRRWLRETPIPLTVIGIHHYEKTIINEFRDVVIPSQVSYRDIWTIHGLGNLNPSELNRNYFLRVIVKTVGRSEQSLDWDVPWDRAIKALDPSTREFW
jgi:hypothetical protein